MSELPPLATARLTFDAGALVRGSIVSTIKNRAWMLGLSVDIEEDKGFLESSYRMTVSGAQDDVVSFGSWIKKVIASHD